jgi:putative hydrolase of HD superfamily
MTDIFRDIELMYEIGSLRNVQRGWLQHLGTNCASDLEHTMRVMFLALALARREGAGNEELIMKMALVHDIAETRTADHSIVQKVYVEADEESAIHDMLVDTSLSNLENVVKLYCARETIEAKLVKDADNLDVDLELKELQEQGHQLPKKWAVFRKLVRDEKLYTKSAKAFWDEIQASDPSSWHLTTNKWLRMPTAGK